MTDTRRHPELRKAIIHLLQSTFKPSDVVWQYAKRSVTLAELSKELEEGSMEGLIFLDQIMLGAHFLVKRAVGVDLDEPKGGLTLCACKHASGHHDFQQGGLCLKHRCGCLAFDPKESVDPEFESEEEVRLERDSLVAMYTRSQTETTYQRQMMMDALGDGYDGSYAVLLMSVCNKLKRLRSEKDKA